jgi:hypothetical protein
LLLPLQLQQQARGVRFAQVKEEPAQRAGDTEQNVRPAPVARSEQNATSDDAHKQKRMQAKCLQSQKATKTPPNFQRKLHLSPERTQSMLGVTDYGTFVVTIIVFLLIPGPGNLALITSTSKGGIAGGLAATMGVIGGDQVLMWSAVAGVAALLAAYPDAFNLVQWVGAAYLAWLGAKMLLAKPGAAPVLNITAGHYFRQALMITLLNPRPSCSTWPSFRCLWTRLASRA